VNGATTDRAGFTLVELTLGLIVASLVALTAITAFVVHHRLMIVSVHSTEIEGALDLVGGVLSAEFRAGLEGRDWGPPAGDSVALRAFRGTAKVCGQVGAVLVVEASGDRALDLAKDSLLVLTRDGLWQTRAVLAASPATSRCAPLSSSVSERWTLDAPVTGAIVARIFERGTYALASGALRYRRGRGGRQPLTGPVIDSLRSTMNGLVGGGVEVRLSSAASHVHVTPRSWTYRVRSRSTAP
jgi:hypothetical protein